MDQPVPQRRYGGKIAVQVRLTDEELAQLDAFITHISETSHGVRISRSEAVKLAAMEGLRVLLPPPPQGKKSPRRK